MDVSGVGSIYQELHKKSKDDPLVLSTRIVRLLFPQHEVDSYPEKNRSNTVATKFLSKGLELPDPPNHSEQNPTVFPIEPGTVSPDTSQELPPEQACALCRIAPSPVTTVEKLSDVDLNESLAKQSIGETSTQSLRRSGRCGKQR